MSDTIDEAVDVEQQLSDATDKILQLPTAEEESEASEEAPAPPQQQLMTAFGLLNSAVIPPAGMQLQLQACEHCQQPKLWCMGQLMQGQPVMFMYCINSMCPGKRQLVIPQQGMPNLRNLR